MAKVSVMGAGSWGLGLAILLNNNGHDVKVWSVFPEEIKVLDKERENKKCLPGVHIPEKIEMTADTEYAVMVQMSLYLQSLRLIHVPLQSYLHCL